MGYTLCHFYFRLQATIFDFRHTQTSDSILTRLSLLRNSENMGITVEISLLSCIKAEIYVMSFLLPVNGRHLWFQTHPDVGQYCHWFFRVAWPCKTWLCCWNFVAIMYISWDTSNYIISAAILDSDFRFHVAVLLIAPLKSLTPKTWSSRQNFVIASLEAEIHLGVVLPPP